MAMVMYLSTCGFVCDNSNVYRTCNIHTDSKCITYNNAFTSNHDTGINVNESHYFASASAFINHSLNPAKCLLSGGTQRVTTKRNHKTFHTLQSSPDVRQMMKMLK